MHLSQARYVTESASDYFAEKRSRYSRALLRGDAEGSMEVVDELIATQQTLGDIYLKVITPALEGVGESWCRGDFGVGEQKLATEIVIGQMDRLRALYAAPPARSLYQPVVEVRIYETHSIGVKR